MKKKCKMTTKKYKMMNVSAKQLKKNIKEVIVPILDNVHGKNIDRYFFCNCVQKKAKVPTSFDKSSKRWS